jgi:CBS domain-containing protein
MATVAEIMTRNPETVTPDSSLMEVARIMRDHDTGIVPIVESGGTLRLVGVITDRDIVIRAVADGKTDGRAEDCMTDRVQWLTPEASTDECMRLMEGSQVRRIPIVDASMRLVGIVSMADLADVVSEDRLGNTLEEISEPDSRQLYSEVNELGRAGNQVQPVQTPTDKQDIAA